MNVFSGEELARWSAGRWEPSPPAELKGVSTDTRAIPAGSLYIALNGDRFDGHDFVADAFRKGASAAMVREGSGIAAGGAQCLLYVEDTLRALQRIAKGHRGKLADTEIIGVTGSAGKSTVKEMTASVLGAAMPTARTLGNWNNHIGVPLSLLAIERSARVGVLEVGMNHPGEIAPLCDLIEPSWGIVTNIGPVHTEFFGTLAAIAEEKSELLKSLPRDGMAVLLKEDAFYGLLRRAAPGRVLTVSMTGEADYTCLSVESTTREVAIRENAGGEEFVFRLTSPGTHNACNALFAVAVARQHGMNWADIRSALETFAPLPMRWSEEDVRGVTVINDAHNANPLSMRAAIDTFAGMATAGHKWLVIAGMLELGKREEEEHAELGRHIARGDWAGLVAVGRLGSHVADAAARAGMGDDRVFRRETNSEAADLLGRLAGRGDAILLKGSRGMRLEEVRDRYVLLSV